MPICIGVDEAGYGPNLGPLVICAAVWRTANKSPLDEWHQELKSAVRRVEDLDEEKNDSAAGDLRLLIDDSKRVYQSGKGLADLERNVLALAALCNGATSDADALRTWLDRSLAESPIHRNWRAGPASKLPLEQTDVERLLDLQSLRAEMRRAKIEVERLAARVLFPCEFNKRLARHDNKAAVLSEATLELVVGLLNELDGEEVIILCDKHGGRDRYYALLAHFFPDCRIKILCEGEEESTYRWGNRKEAKEIRFCARGERFLPTAAASMTAKYVREICMAEWNAFWRSKIPTLVPTAGYPLDARRFLAEIETVANQLGLAPDSYWRKK